MLARNHPSLDDPGAKRTYFGRNGSPEVTVVFPFAKVEVTRTDDVLRASIVGALQSIDVLAEQVHALAQATSKAERVGVTVAIEALRVELDELITETATATDR